jgi:hypothetical protein
MWQELFGIKSLLFNKSGRFAAGWQVVFNDILKKVPPQIILTDFLVDHIYPVEPSEAVSVLAKIGNEVIGTHKVHTSSGTTSFLGFRPRDDQAASLGYETRTWFEILTALNAYPHSGGVADLNDNPSVVSRTTPFVACRFPNGTISIAPHFCRYVENWPGGFHRDQKQDEEILRNYPLPSPDLKLTKFRVAGHEIDYQGFLTVAFRLQDERLIAFAGQNCNAITLNGVEHEFANQQLLLAAWAPVLPSRQIPGGAVMELWVEGEAEMQIPVLEMVSKCKLYSQGQTIDSLGEQIDCSCAGGILRFNSSKSWGQKHLYLTSA